MPFSYILSSQNNWPSPSSVGQFFYIVLLVVFVALLAYFSTRLLATSKGARGRYAKRNLEVLESIGVGAQAMAQIVRAGERFFLIGVTKERVTLLSELNGEQLVLNEGKPAGTTFDKLLKRVMKGGAPPGNTDSTDGGMNQ